MKAWQIREKHDKDVKRVLQEDGCMDSMGRIRAWRRHTADKLSLCGHSSLDHKLCQCAV